MNIYIFIYIDFIIKWTANVDRPLCENTRTRTTTLHRLIPFSHFIGKLRWPTMALSLSINRKLLTLLIIIKLKKINPVALQPRREKTDWNGCCHMAVQGALWLAKRSSLNLNPYSAKGLGDWLYATLHKMPVEDGYSFCLFIKS